MEHDAGVFFAVNINDAASLQTFLGIPDMPDTANTSAYINLVRVWVSLWFGGYFEITLQSLNKAR